MGVAGANQLLETYYIKKKADKLCLSDIDRKSGDDKLSNEAEEIQIVRSKVNRHSTPIANSGSSKIRDDLNSSCPSRLDHKPKKSKKKRTKDHLTTASGSEDTLMNSSNASLNSSFIGSSKSSKKVNSGQKMKDTWKEMKSSFTNQNMVDAEILANLLLSKDNDREDSPEASLLDYEDLPIINVKEQSKPVQRAIKVHFEDAAKPITKTNGAKNEGVESDNSYQSMDNEGSIGSSISDFDASARENIVASTESASKLVVHTHGASGDDDTDCDIEIVQDTNATPTISSHNIMPRDESQFAGGEDKLIGAQLLKRLTIGVMLANQLGVDRELIAGERVVTCWNDVAGEIEQIAKTGDGSSEFTYFHVFENVHHGVLI
jgi:hypothetical protein